MDQEAPPKTILSFEDTATGFALKTNREVRLGLLLYGVMNRPWLVRLGIGLTRMTLGLSPVRALVRKTLFRQFAGGETLDECHTTSLKLMEAGVRAFLAYSVEGKDTEADYEATTLETIRTLEFARDKPAIPFSVFKVTGLARFALLEKVQTGEPLTAEETAEFERVKERCDRIYKAAAENDVRVLVDAEESWIQIPIDDLAYAGMARYNQKKAIVYNTFQMYLAHGFERLQKAAQAADLAGYHLGVKLVRGAYLEKEAARANAMGYPDPVNPTKAASDAMYDRSLEFLLARIERCGLLAGTHNEASAYLIADLCQRNGIAHNHPNLHTGQLYGMSDHITFNLAHAGFNALKYVPYGPVQEVMPYLFRRAHENTSIAGQTNREYQLLRTEWHRRKNR